MSLDFEHLSHGNIDAEEDSWEENDWKVSGPSEELANFRRFLASGGMGNFSYIELPHEEPYEEQGESTEIVVRVVPNEVTQYYQD